MMTASPIRHILFDLGGTLMHSREDWSPILERADQALINTLAVHDIKLDNKLFRARLHQYYEQRDQDYQETTYHFVLRELLKELGYDEVTESVIRSALDALYSITQNNWTLEDEAIPALRTLNSNQYRLGILSNAGDDKDVQELIESFGIRQYFDFVLTSAACYYRKPHPRAFELALARWNISPEEAVMVGDTLNTDIFGANKLNMRTIWVTRRAEFNADEKLRFKPDFELTGLNELFPTLQQIHIPFR